MSTVGTTHPLQQRWARLRAREQRLVLAALVLVVLAFLWLVLLQPPLKSLDRADQQRQTLALQEQTLLQLQAQAQALRARPALTRQDVLQGLQSAIGRLGGETALQVQGDVARLTLTRVPAAALAAWLAGGATQSVAGSAGTRLQPFEASLTRSGTASAPTWDGRLFYQLPPEGGATRDTP